MAVHTFSVLSLTSLSTHTLFYFACSLKSPPPFSSHQVPHPFLLLSFVSLLLQPQPHPPLPACDFSPSWMALLDGHPQMASWLGLRTLSHKRGQIRRVWPSGLVFTLPLPLGGCQWGLSSNGRPLEGLPHLYRGSTQGLICLIPSVCRPGISTAHLTHFPPALTICSSFASVTRSPVYSFMPLLTS